MQKSAIGCGNYFFDARIIFDAPCLFLALIDFLRSFFKVTYEYAFIYFDLELIESYTILIKCYVEGLPKLQINLHSDV